MATLPTPRTWISGETPTAPMLNTELRDNWAFLLNPPRVKVYNTTGQSISGDTLLTWDTQIYDSDGMWAVSPNPSRLVAVTAGCYEIVLHINWAISNVANPGNRYAAVKLNAAGDNDLDLNLTQQIGCDAANITPNDNTSPQTSHISFPRFLNANDYVEAVVGASAVTVQTIVSGAAARTFFGMRWIGAA